MKKKIEKEFKKVLLSDLRPYENNPRINDDAVDGVVESMRQTGNIDPIEVDDNGVILSGHTRLLALKKLGYTETEVMQVTGLTEKEKRKYRILANKTQEVAQWDDAKLAEEMIDLDFGDFDFGLPSVDVTDEPLIEKKELTPFKKVHYLITVDVNDHDKIVDTISLLRGMEGVEIDSTLN